MTGRNSLSTPFWKAQDGGVVLIFALASPIIFGLSTAAISYSGFVNNKIRIQQAADAAALAVVGDMRVSDGNQSRIEAVARATAASQLQMKAGASPLSVAVTKTFPTNVSTGFSVVSASGATVTLSKKFDSVFSFLPELNSLTLSATSTAKFLGSSKLCVVSIEASAADAIHLKDAANIDARECSVYANSKSPSALRTEGASLIKSNSLCTGGGYSGSSLNYMPPPKTDCPSVKDPLAVRQAPSIGSCNYTNLTLIGVTQTLSPGTYCGGLVVDKGAQVTLNPGIYVMKDGPLIVGPGGSVKTTTSSGSSSNCQQSGNNSGNNSGCGSTSTISNIGYLRGTNVGFYFTGTVAPDGAGVSRPMRFMKDSVVELTAPKDGDLAGLLFFEDRSAAPNRLFEVMSDSARKLVGTIYLSRGIFSVSANQSVADRSEYTAIVVNRLDLSQAPRLVINTNYFGTDVPVPDGIGPYSSMISLAK